MTCDCSKVLAARRRSLGLTQAEVARPAQITQSHLSRIERGEGKVSEKTIRTLARILRVENQKLCPEHQEEELFSTDPPTGSFYREDDSSSEGGAS